jgi:hypothetical protein
VLISLTDADVVRDRVRTSKPERSPIGCGLPGIVSPDGLQDPNVEFGASTFRDTDLYCKSVLYLHRERQHISCMGKSVLCALSLDQDPQPTWWLSSLDARRW